MTLQTNPPRPESPTTWAGASSITSADLLVRFKKAHKGKKCTGCPKLAKDAKQIWYGNPEEKTVTCPACHAQK